MKRIVNIGSFNVTSGKLVVAECGRFQGELLLVRNGVWYACVAVVDDESSNGYKPLCAELLVYVEPIGTETTWQRASFGVGTEGGIAGIWDSDSYTRMTADDFDEFSFDNECANAAIKCFDDRPIVEAQETRFGLPARETLDVNAITQEQKDAIRAWCGAYEQRKQEIIEARNAWVKTDAAIDAGIVAEGVVSYSGHGDGAYPCEYVTKNGEITAVRIVFISYEDSDNESKGET